ncbi:MAG TPA: ABC transporter permease subunit [Desulfobacteria bacterium]|nr:ABC transporter permease subunit [Desulfobacteria bacterium]
MSAKGLWQKEFNASKFKFAAGIVLPIALAISIPYLYESLTGIMQSIPIPEFAREQVEMFKDFNYYVWFNWFGKNLFQIVGMLAIIFGAGLISTEVSRKTVYFLLTKPISRQQVFAVKYLTSLASLEAIVVISTIVLYLSVSATGHSLPVIKLTQNGIMAIAGFALIYSIAVYFSTVFDQALKSALVSFLIVVLLSVPNFVTSFRPLSLYYQMTGLSIYKGEGFPYIPLLVIAAVTAAIYKLAEKRFVRSDF